jgi:hypothetical protein
VDSNPHPSLIEARGPPPAVVVAVEQPEASSQESPADDGATGEPVLPGIVDNVSLLGASTVTIVQLTL